MSVYRIGQQLCDVFQTGLIKDIGILLNPVEQSLRMFRYWVQYFVCCNINCNVGSPSGSHLKVLISGNLVGDFPVKRLAVSLKILLIFLTVSLTVKMQRF